jgi:hypothetical protein
MKRVLRGRYVTLDVTVSLQRRHHDVEEPEEDEEGGGGNFPISGSTQFTSDHFVTPQHHQAHGHDGCTAEQRHREGQAVQPSRKINISNKSISQWTRETWCSANIAPEVDVYPGNLAVKGPSAPSAAKLTLCSLVLPAGGRSDHILRFSDVSSGTIRNDFHCPHRSNKVATIDPDGPLCSARKQLTSSTAFD